MELRWVRLWDLCLQTFMCELENKIIPQLNNYINNWTRYVDDTLAFINPDKINEVKQCPTQI